MSVDYSGALSALRKYMESGIEARRSQAEKSFDLGYESTEEKQEIEEQVRKNKRSTKKMEDRMSWGNLIGTAIGIITGNPIIGAAASYAAQEIGQQAGGQPKSIDDGKFYSDVREDYNQSLEDYKKSANWNQLANAGMAALTTYQADKWLTKEGGWASVKDWLGIGEEASKEPFTSTINLNPTRSPLI